MFNYNLNHSMYNLSLELSYLKYISTLLEFFFIHRNKFYDCIEKIIQLSPTLNVFLISFHYYATT